MINFFREKLNQLMYLQTQIRADVPLPKTLASMVAQYALPATMRERLALLIRANDRQEDHHKVTDTPNSICLFCGDGRLPRGWLIIEWNDMLDVLDRIYCLNYNSSASYSTSFDNLCSLVETNSIATPHLGNNVYSDDYLLYENEVWMSLLREHMERFESTGATGV